MNWRRGLFKVWLALTVVLTPLCFGSALYQYGALEERIAHMIAWVQLEPATIKEFNNPVVIRRIFEASDQSGLLNIQALVLFGVGLQLVLLVLGFVMTRAARRQKAPWVNVQR